MLRAILFSAAIISTSLGGSFSKAALQKPPAQEPAKQEWTGLEEVRAAVLGIFGSDEVYNTGREEIATWGESAVPALRVLAGEEFGVLHGDALAFACLMGEPGTRRLNLLVDMLAGGTKVDTRNALFRLENATNLRVRAGLASNGKFKPIMIGFGGSVRPGCRMQFLRVAAWMGWNDCVPKMKALLLDSNQRVRDSAAFFLSELTGKKVTAEPLDRAFPGARRIPGLVGEPVAIQLSFSTRGDYVIDFDGQPRLLLGDGKSVRPCQADGTLGHRRRYGNHCMSTNSAQGVGADRYMVIHGSEDGYFSSQYVFAANSRGKELWRYPSHGESDVEGTGPLLGADGATGTLLSIDSELVALDSRGRVLWVHADSAPADGLLSHPELPGDFYTFFADFSHYHCSLSGVEVKQLSVPCGMYIGVAKLFPDSKGRPSLILGGSSSGGVIRVDERGEEIWAALGREGVNAMAMIEPEGHPRVFFFTTERNRFYAIDEDGRLLHERSIPRGAGDVDTDMTAGRSSATDWSVCLNWSKGCLVFPLDLRGL